MFTRAEFNLRGRRIAYARIVPAGQQYRRSVMAVLWRFECGDYAWVTDRFVAWPAQCSIYNLIGRDLWFSPYDPKNSSRLPQ